MKIIPRLWCALCVVALGFNSHAATNDSSPRLTIELCDGSRVVGQSTDDAFKFQSPLLGQLKLAVNDIRSIECTATNSAKLTTAAGDALTVRFTDSELRVITGFGKVELPVNSIRHLTVSVTGNSGRIPEGLVALWSGEGNANDSVGGCNGQLVNGGQFTSGKVGQAFSLNEDGDGNSFLLIPASPALNVGNGDGFTIAAWIKPSTVSEQMIIIYYENKLGTTLGANEGMNFAIQGNQPGGGMLAANIVDTMQTSHNIATPAKALIAGVWQHIALTYDKISGLAALYVNGANVAQADLESFTPQTSFKNLLFGAATYHASVSNPHNVFEGAMDEISIYNRALTATEIQSLCPDQNHGGTPSTQN